MSSAGRAVNSSGCAARPKGREIGLIGFAAQIRRSSLTGSYVMETAEHREPCESRGSRTVLGAPGGEIPPGDSTDSDLAVGARHVWFTPHKQTLASGVSTAAMCQKLPLARLTRSTCRPGGELTRELQAQFAWQFSG